MVNFIENGDSIQILAPVGGIVGGQVVKIGDLVGVAVSTKAEGEQVTISLDGVFEVPKKPAEAVAMGQKLYYDDVNHYLTVTAGALVLAGYAFNDALAADATVYLKIKE